MARIVYALSGQGRGHASRVLAVARALRARGHELRFCCGGTARAVLEACGETVWPVPSLCQVLHGNRMRLLATLRANLPVMRRLRPLLDELTEKLADFRPHLVITDFEALTPRAAARLGLPVLSFNHQQVVTETRYRLPLRYWKDALLAHLAIQLIVPRRPLHVLLTSFYFPPLRHPERVTLIPPIIRDEVQALMPTTGSHVLVYFNQPEGVDHLPEVLARLPASFVLYNVPRPPDAEKYTNLTFKAPSIEGFLEDLARCRAVLCTAGFTLMSEALYLGKPLLVVPNRGIFEQTLNALFLEREGLGMAVFDRELRSEDVRRFLEACPHYEKRLQSHSLRCGNEMALNFIERLLQRLETSRYRGRPARPPRENATLSFI
ncbi:glycosyltransferase family protein [Rhodothermus marinus]|uniref:Glycosyltransferase 28 domain protein n=1 Tax=Rhodothermus marinus (strain ATCC 43812 / DSM 4252 / R-10) TaxID=518766 RepID=D0MEC7_RHOM4|nr:glycosyltransferase family protein [Rhodothermus marinus]ACY47351.1 Glycosyltransferase 28 domain protein [Rhodothermus marinus DSM 4252]